MKMMDMNTPISPLILQSFYILLLEEAGIAAVIVAVLWIMIRYGDGSRLLWQGSEDVTLSPAAASAAGSYLRMRRWFSAVFGLLWILDGFLQAQPAMTTQFIPGLIQPIIQALPGSLPQLLGPGAYLWTLHPLLFDSLSAIVQILIGVCFWIGPDRLIGRAGLYLSIAWSVMIWVFGEGFGGLFNTPTWLVGVPGSATVYLFAAVLILTPIGAWASGQVRRTLSLGIGILWFILALFQAWPDSGFWSFGGLDNAILPMAQMSQPKWMSAPLYSVANGLNQAPALFNGVFVAILTALALLWILRPRTRGLALFTGIWTFLTWWIGQDFGVVGGLGTDPNTGLPLLILVVLTARLYQTAPVALPIDDTWASRKLMIYTTVGSSVAAVLALALLGQSLESSNNQAAIAPALAQAGLTATNLHEPDMTFTNQYGVKTSLAAFRGKALILTFLDPVCYDVCPLFAKEMAHADQLLGPLSSQVELVAICANPIFHSVKDLQRFDAEMNLNTLPNWQYLTANVPTLERAWQSLYEYVNVQSLGMVDHADNVYFIAPSGQVKWLGNLSESEGLGGATSAMMADYAARLVNATPPTLSASPLNLGVFHTGVPHKPGFDSMHMLTKTVGWATKTVGPYEEVLHTVDAGRHWQSVTPTGISQRGGLLLAPISSTQAFALIPPFGYNANASLFETLDAGRHWKLVGEPGPLPPVHDPAFTADAAGQLQLTGTAGTTSTSDAAGASPRNVTYRSQNEGASWHIGGRR